MNERSIVMFLAFAFAGALTDPATADGHHFACADYLQGKVFIVSAAGTVEWECDAPACNDLWVLPSGNLLFNTGHGVREVDRDKNTVFQYDSASEVHACQRLPNGDTFIGECNSGRMLEVAPSGAIVKETRLLPEGTDGGHAYIRNARRLDNGHYLVAHYADQAAREYDADGKLVWEVPAPGGAHTVVRLPDGNTLISCGDAAGDSAKVFEVDAAGQTVWEVTSRDLPGITLRFVAGVERLPNGNTVMCNWLGHGHLGEGPHLIEVTPDKQVVWAFADHQTMKTMSAIQILDAAGDALGSAPLR